MLFAKTAWGIDVFEFFKRMPGNIRSVSVTSTNMVIEFNWSSILQVELSREPYIYRRSREYAANKEPLILVPDKEIALHSRHASIYFKPVAFKNQHMGFRIINEVDNRSVGREIMTNIIVHVALSDTPIEVGEDDVEMVMERGEWKKFEREVEATTSPPSRENPVATMQDETPDNVTEDEPSEGRATASPPFRLWIYALIPLCLLAVLWVVKRKRKRDSP